MLRIVGLVSILFILSIVEGNAQEKSRAHVENKDVQFVDFEQDLSWLELDGESINRTLQLLRISPAWKELPPTKDDYRRFQRRESRIIHDNVLYRQSPTAAIQGAPTNSKVGGGSIEIIISDKATIKFPKTDFWRGFRGSLIKHVEKTERPQIKVKQIVGNFHSEVIFYTESMAVKISETSKTLEREFTNRWMRDLKLFLDSELSSISEDYKSYATTWESNEEDGAIQLMNTRVVGLYDLFGFVNTKEDGLLWIRMLDLDLNEYIDFKEFRDTIEFVGFVGKHKTNNYWNCYIKPHCRVNGVYKKSRNIRIELFFSPERKNATKVKLSELVVNDLTCWQF